MNGGGQRARTRLNAVSSTVNATVTETESANAIVIMKGPLDAHTRDELAFSRTSIIYLPTYVSVLPMLYTNTNINPDPDNDPN